MISQTAGRPGTDVFRFPAIDELFRKYSSVAQPAPKLWRDGYLAAHAVSNNAQLITFDQGFREFGIDCTIL